MPDPPKVEPTQINVEELMAKVNTLTSQLEQERILRIRTEKVAKVNAMNPDFKADDKMSADFLDGVAYAYANPIKPKENSAKSPQKPKENALPPTPTGGAPKAYNTPDGKPIGDKPLAIFAGNWNNTDTGGGF